MKLRAGVIGVGAMGRHHARNYANIDGVELVGIADASEGTAQKMAQQFGGTAYTDYEAMLAEAKPDLVTIAVPTVHHLAVAQRAIEQGIHVLLEKPIAFSVDEGRQIIDLAAKADVRLMVGHIERFNPAITALKERLAAGELGRVFQIDARRQGPFPARIQDVGVVIDLAVHDLDVIRYVTGVEITRVFAETERQIHSSHEDLLTGLVRLADGTIGTLMVNWLTPTKIRQLDVIGEKGMFRVDYLTQDLYFYENGAAPAGDWPFRDLRGVSEGRMIRFVVPKMEPLRAEIEAFLAAVRGEAPVPVSGEDGLRALHLAQSVVLSGIENRPVAV